MIGGMDKSPHVEEADAKGAVIHDWSGWDPDSGVGKLWVSDWEGALSGWAEQFDLIINCSDRVANYRRWTSYN